MGIQQLRDDFYRYRKQRGKIALCREAYGQLAESEKKCGSRFELEWSEKTLSLDEDTAATVFDRHYIYHTAWAFRKVLQINPAYHTDISSSLYFIGMLSAVVPVRFYDYRPANLELNGLVNGKADLSNLPFGDNSLHSLSSMHVVEHIGLGRYGDPIDYDGDLRAMNELMRVVAPQGHLLFVTPVGGKARIQFNAHRIYTHWQILSQFSQCHLAEFALIPDREEQGGIVVSPSDELLAAQEYACGCYHFIKK